ncbi:MAG: PAS domain-containing protein [Sphingobacteriales bacterium]|nr:PAS domain-containing protein [Sphingobacteriales bacterium]
MGTLWKDLRSIFSSSGMQERQYLIILDENGNILKANSRMLKEFNLKNPGQAESNFFNLIHPVHIENFKNAFRYSSQNSNPYPVELVLKNGHIQPMNWQVNFLTAGPYSKSFICVGNVIAAGKKPDAIQVAGFGQKAAILQAFMKNTPNMAWAIDEDATLLMANPVFLNYFRLTEDALNKKIAEIIPLSVVDALYAHHIKVFQTGLPLEVLEKTKMADGSTAVFRVAIFPVDGIEGKKMAAGIAINYADKYYAEKNLKKANERLSQLSRVTSDAIWEWDMLSGEIFRNEKLIEMIGCPPSDHGNLAWWISRVHPEDRDQLTDKLKEVTDKSLQSWESEYRFLCTDGEYKNMLDRGYVIYEKGMPVKMIGSLHDITNEKLMTNLLMEEKLRQYKNISEAAMRVQEQERTRLGREMHDNVNQLLSTIKMFIGLLTPANAQEQEIKQKASEYTLLAIEEIRKLSREMVSPQLNGDSLAENIQKIISDIELSSGLRIRFAFDSDHEILSPGKKLTLYRIVQEQLKNIIKYSKAKKAEILLLTRDNQVQLSIKDDGIGFDMKKTNPGIGLASIRDRANFYNGKTEIIASPGKGCEVTVSIPLLDSD